MRSSEVLRRLIREETAAQSRQVVAPLDGQGRIGLDMDGLVWLLQVETPSRGWGVFEVLPSRRARWVRPADPWEIDGYARRGQRLTATVVEAPQDGRCLAVLGSSVALVRLTPDVAVFDEVEVCYDGARCWCLGTRARDPRIEPLQLALSAWREAPPPGTRPRLQAAYAVAFALQQQAGSGSTGPGPVEERVRAALEQAGAHLQSIRGAGRALMVQWRQAGASYQTTIDATTLGVVSAGVCLSGRDSDFDLTSLVSVMREREQHVPEEYYR